MAKQFCDCKGPQTETEGLWQLLSSQIIFLLMKKNKSQKIKSWTSVKFRGGERAMLWKNNARHALRWSSHSFKNISWSSSSRCKFAYCACERLSVVIKMCQKSHATQQIYLALPPPSYQTQFLNVTMISVVEIKINHLNMSMLPPISGERLVQVSSC